MAVSEAVRSAFGFLTGRARAYKRRLDPADRDADVILTDLMRFCHANEPLVVRGSPPDPLVTARLDGRREVWLRIQRHINLDDETLWRLYDGRERN